VDVEGGEEGGGADNKIGAGNVGHKFSIAALLFPYTFKGHGRSSSK
jgi:hypothetical protein